MLREKAAYSSFTDPHETEAFKAALSRTEDLLLALEACNFLEDGFAVAASTILSELRQVLNHQSRNLFPGEWKLNWNSIR